MIVYLFLLYFYNSNNINNNNSSFHYFYAASFFWSSFTFASTFATLSVLHEEIRQVADYSFGKCSCIRRRYWNKKDELGIVSGSAEGLLQACDIDNQLCG